MDASSVSNMLHEMDDMMISSLLSYLPGPKFLLASKVCKRYIAFYSFWRSENDSHLKGGMKSYGSMTTTRAFGGDIHWGDQSRDDL
eukprot:752224-Hanusia_phi.AAC.4